MSELETQIEAGQEAIRETTGLLSRLLDQLTARLPSILVALVVFVLGMLLATLINKTIFHTMKRAKLNKTAASFGRSLVRILLYTILLMICLSIAGVPMASIIAVVGAAGMAIALALQKNPGLRPEEIKLKLYESVEKNEGMRGGYTKAWGNLHVDNLLRLI